MPAIAPNKGKTYPPEVLTPDEVREILATCSRRAPTGVRDRALITVMYRCGLRVSEALDLRPSDIDMKRGIVHVRDGKGHKARSVGIGDGALAVIELWLITRRSLGLAHNGTPLFCTLKGGPVSDDAVRNMLRRRAARAGIEKRVHPHALRHSYAFELAEKGTPVNKIQQLLGHSSLQVTSTYLDHIAPVDAIAVGRADDWTDE